MHEHVVGHGQHVAVHVDCGGHHDLRRPSGFETGPAPAVQSPEGGRPARREAGCPHSHPGWQMGLGGWFAFVWCCFDWRLLLFRTRYPNYSLISYYANK